MILIMFSCPVEAGRGAMLIMFSAVRLKRVRVL